MPELVTVKIHGLDELQKKLQEQLPKDAKRAMRIALSAGAGDIKRAMQAAAPEEQSSENSGFLKSHINVKTRIHKNDLAGTAFIGPSTAAYPGREGKRGRVRFKTVTGKIVDFVSNRAGEVTAARVARFLEFGTSKMGKHAFMTQAFESSKDTALQHIIAKLREVLKLS
jgi:phage protein, HK97 gp10 family